MEFNYERLPLSIGNSKLYLISSKLEKNKEELESFIQDNKYMNSKDFSKNVLFSQEIKANNTIEGYNDDVGLVYDILNKNIDINDKQRMTRIINLYNGYKYIFENKKINKENLRKLYSILSKGLLEQRDLENMGDYYRNEPVYIFYSFNMDVEPDTGVNVNDLEKYMNEYFDYINNNNKFACTTDYFIKSQIMHFQFVNIHPYFDINGRTSRTISMWYLLNNKAYPYIIFNRAISLNKQKYYKVIRDVKKFHNVTFFLNYMLENVKVELEKEYIMDMIKSNSGKLTAVDYQSMYYILSMNGILTVKDFIEFYNRNNDKKRVMEIYKEMIIPLLDKGIILKGRETGNHLNSEIKNFVFKLNDSRYEKDPNRIKKLKL